MALCALACGCAVDSEDPTSETAQAVGVSTPIGQQDTPDPGDVPPPPSAYGAPLPAPTPPAALVTAQKAYAAKLVIEERRWDAEGRAESDKNQLRAQLKASMLGGWQ